MNKLGRKKSSDPTREALRQEKQDWNEDTSELIKSLISLKKGLNGRGDSSEGLPPSSIKDPVPPQIGAYLNEVASSAAKVIEEAKNIIHHQNHYSSSRNRPKKSFENEQNIIKVSELISEASWFGSRFLARNWGLRNLPANQKSLVIDMMYKLLDIKDQLDSFEEHLIETKQKGIAKSFKESMHILALYKSGILDKMLQFVGKEKTPHVSADESKPIQPSMPVPAAKSVEVLDKTPTPARDREAGRRSGSEAKSQRTEEFQEIGKELSYLGRIQELIDHGIIFPINDANEFHNKATDLDNEYNVIHNLLRTANVPVSHVQKLIAALQVSHSNLIAKFLETFCLAAKKDKSNWVINTDIDLVNASYTLIRDLNLEENNILNNFSFQDIYLKLPLADIQKYQKEKEEKKKEEMEKKTPNPDPDPKIDEPQQGGGSIITSGFIDESLLIKIDESLLIKDAGFFRKFIREKILNFNPSAIEIEQRNALYASKEVKKQINEFLDLLEDPSTTRDSMVDALNKLTSEFKNLFSLMKSLGEAYRLLPTDSKEEISSREVTYYDKLIKSMPDKI